MRIIVEMFGRAWGAEFNILHVKMTSPGDEPEPEPDAFEHIPMDPHGTLSSHIERRSDMEDAFGAAPKSFGFRGTSG